MNRSVRRRGRTPRAPALGAAALVLAPLAAARTSGAVARPVPARSATSSAAGEWTTYGGSPSRTSAQPASPPLLPLRRRWTSARLDGPVYGEPLVLSGLVYVATESDSVYALRAATGAVAWRRSIGVPAPASLLPCGDISPVVGVTSTMVLDPANGTLLVSAETSRSGAVHHVLVALDARTGALRWERDLDQPGWTASAQLQRAALALDAGRVLVGFGGNYGDCSTYHGWLLAVPESGVGPTLSYRVPTAREGAIWGPSGVAVGPTGDVLVATGNGSSSTTYDHGDSVIELDPGLRPVGYFAPVDWASLNSSDADLGSTGPMLLSDGRVVQVGKGGVAYLLDSSRLGGIGGEVARLSTCFAIGGDAYLAPFAYLPCVDGSLEAVLVGTSALRPGWTAAPVDGASPTVAAGVVWTLGNPGHLLGTAARTGRVVVDLPVVPVEHYAAPAAGDGLLVVAGTSRVEAFAGPRGLVLAP